MASISIGRCLSARLLKSSRGEWAEESDGASMQPLVGKVGCPNLTSSFLLPMAKKSTSPAKRGYARGGKTIKISAVLDKSSGMGTSGQSSNEPLDPARSALERLFAQAQRHEERLLDPDYATETELENAVAQIEKDLEAALDALREKEQQLREAEEMLKDDRLELQRARASLAKREKRLEVAEWEEKGKEGEIEMLRTEVKELGKELEEANGRVREKERELRAAQAALRKLEEEFNKANEKLAERDETVGRMLIELKKSQSDLNAKEERERERERELKQLAEYVKRQDVELKASREELKVRQVKLMETEKDLEARVTAWLGAQDEIEVLERDLSSSKAAGSMTKRELDHAKELLADVQKELQTTQLTVVRFRHDLLEQKDSLGKTDKELESQRSVMRMRELELAQARREAHNSKEQLRLARAGYDRVSKILQDQQHETDRLQVALTAGKQAVKDSIFEMNTLKKQIRQKDAALSDAELAVQLKEAEVIGLKLELQEVKSELLVAEVALKDKSVELELAAKQVESLQLELIEVKEKLTEKESELAKMSILLKEKDCTIAAMRADLNSTSEKLSEATTVVEQIAALSKSLAQSAAATSLPVSVGDNEVLMQTNFELFAANRALLERELELQRLQERENNGNSHLHAIEAELQAVKDSLKQKEVEMASMKAALEQKNEELRRLLDRWEAREAELATLRQDVLEEARALAGLKASKVQGVGREKEERSELPKLEQMELEVAKLEVETALFALQGLADLSQELLEECHLEASCAGYPRRKEDADSVNEETLGWASRSAQQMEAVAAAGELNAAAEELAKLQLLKVQLNEKDAALELAKNAMDSLTRLTQKLVNEAGVTSADYELANAVSGSA